MAFLTGRELRIYVLIVVILTIIALAITLTVMTVRNRPRASSEKGPELALEQSSPGLETFLDPSEDLVQKIQIPDEYTRLYDREWRPFRPVHERWTREMTAPYWIDPQELVQEELEKQTDHEISRFFEGVP
jgi:hypothetical protein